MFIKSIPCGLAEAWKPPPGSTLAGEVPGFFFGGDADGIVIFLAGMIVGGFIGVFLLALVSSNHEGEDEIPDDTDREG